MQQVIFKLYTNDGREIQVRKKHSYYTVWRQSDEGQQFSKWQSAYARNQDDAFRMANYLLTRINSGEYDNGNA